MIRIHEEKIMQVGVVCPRHNNPGRFLYPVFFDISQKGVDRGRKNGIIQLVILNHFDALLVHLQDYKEDLNPYTCIFLVGNTLRAGIVGDFTISHISDLHSA